MTDAPVLGRQVVAEISPLRRAAGASLRRPPAMAYLAPAREGRVRDARERVGALMKATWINLES